MSWCSFGGVCSVVVVVDVVWLCGSGDSGVIVVVVVWLCDSGLIVVVV